MEELKRRRGAAKGWIKRELTNINVLMDNPESSEVEIVQALKELDKRVDKLESIQDELESLYSEEELNIDLDTEYEFQSNYRKVKISAETIIAGIQSRNNQGEGRLSNHNSAEKSAQLPKIQINKFTGEHTEWPTFKDKFEALIGKSDISTIAKFSYLQSLLSGEALTCIEGLSLTSENYSHAFNILDERFGRKEKIIFSHIQKLIGIEVGNSKNIKNLWSLHNQLQSHIRSLENFGISRLQYGVILTPLILSRLPHDLRLEWARNSDNKESDLDFLMDFLYKEIVRRERSNDFSGSFVPVLEKRQCERKRDTASALLTNGQKAGVKNCVFCDKRHHATECADVSSMDPEEAKRKLRDSKLCFVCFRPFGYKHNNYCKTKCLICAKKHNTAFCPERKGNSGSADSNPNTQAAFYSKSEFTGRQTMLQTCEITINGKRAVILFDSAADRSYISSSFVKSIKPKFVGREDTSFCAFGSVVPSGRMQRNVYELNVQSEHGVSERLCLTEINDICKTMYRPSIPVQFLNFFHCHGLDFGDSARRGRVRVDILIGLDYYWKLIQPGKVISSPEGLVAQQTIFGKWVLSGSWPSQGQPSSKVSNQYLTLDSVSDETIRKFWDVESLGIVDAHEAHVKSSVLTEFNKTIKFSDNRYEVSLPWKSEEMKGKLLNNYNSAKVRADKLDSKLAQNSKLKEEYRQVFQTLESEGIIQEVPESEVDSSTGPVYYLPHFPVVKEESVSTKVRPVFDASSHGPNGISLNDCVDVGPNMLANLAQVMLRFRRWPVALTSDIRKAFLSIRLCKADRDVQRFILKDGENIRIMRCERVIFGCASSPFLLNATIQFHLGQYDDSNLVQEMRDNIYMDDLLTGCDNVNQACDVVEKATQIMADGGMQLSKWASNSSVVKDKLHKDFKDATSQKDVVKVLGLTWDSSCDHFDFGGCPIFTDVVITKRFVLSLLSRIFDPLGFLVPFTMEAKVIFQELWTLGLDWDEEVPHDMKTRFTTWINGLSQLRTWTVPRCYVTHSWSNKKSLELYCFCDASEKGYCAAVYIKVIEENDSRSMSLVMAKARVAPVKRVTLPRLELLGCLLGARLVTYVRKALFLPDNTIYCCWTDSMVALQWIRSDPYKWKTFVANRVSEIQQLTCPSKWKHCPGEQNPADLGTRGVSARTLMASQVWLTGGSLLTDNYSDDTMDMDDSSLSMVTTLEQCTEDRFQRSIGKVTALPVERWGAFQKAIRIVAWILRFAHNCCHKKDGKRESGTLTVEELERSNWTLLKHIQLLHFPEEINDLKRGKAISKGSILNKLNPFLSDDGLLRLKGRLQFSNMSYEAKHPIILPKCHISELIIRREHLQLKHAGVPLMLSSIRNQFWIIGLRSLARKVKRKCVNCARFDSLPCQQPIAPLPEERIQRSSPFFITGVDFAGPLYTADCPGRKFYICLFTCGTIRAIHLELVDNLSVDQFMLAFKRFVSRRCLPSCIFSDQAKTFKAAAQKLIDEYADISPKWKFIKPRSPWVGGMWERMVRSVKSSLKKCIGLKRLTKTELVTLMCEIEVCINSRPLTFVGDTLDSLEPLTPNHFIKGGSGHSCKESDQSDQRVTVTATGLKEVARTQAKELEKFWAIWSDDYIRNLPNVPLAKQRGRLKVGTVVLIRVDNCPRLYWPLGKVTKILHSKDNLVRTVEVKTKKGLFIRPIQRIHILEVSDDIENVNDCEDLVPMRDMNGSNNISPDTQSNTNASGADFRVNKPVVSRVGRIVKPKKMLDL